MISYGGDLLGMLSLQGVNVIDSEVILVGSEVQSEEKKAVTEDPSDLMSKDELLQGMEKVDREISQVEQQINNLKKKQVRLVDVGLEKIHLSAANFSAVITVQFSSTCWILLSIDMTFVCDLSLFNGLDT